jgi:hypothetical protein
MVLLDTHVLVWLVEGSPPCMITAQDPLPEEGRGERDGIRERVAVTPLRLCPRPRDWRPRPVLKTRTVS